MKKKICIVDSPEQGQGVYELLEGPAVRLDRDTGGLEQFRHALIVEIRRLGSGLLELEVELLEKDGEMGGFPEPTEEDSDPANLWLRAGYLWGMVSNATNADDRAFLYRTARSLVAFARSLAYPLSENGLAEIKERHKKIEEAPSIRSPAHQDRGRLLALVEQLYAELAKHKKVELLEKRWSLEEIKEAWLRAQDGGPAGSRDEGDLENSWDHVRGALTGEEV